MTESPPKTRILLAEDEPNFGAVLRDFLQMNDFEVELARDGVEALERFRPGDYDLCVLDVMMPKMDGFTLAERIRKQGSEVPIIFLTARGLKEDVHKGFRKGGDDYITKPFDSEELLLRIQAVLRRSSPETIRAEALPEEFEFRRYYFNARLNVLNDGQEEFKLSPKESELLQLLLAHQNDLLSREEALQRLWGDDNYFNARSMDVFISKLRKRFRDDPGIKIENVHGRGFSMVVE